MKAKLLGALLMYFIVNSHSYAADPSYNVKFTGKIVSSTCEISTDSTNQTVPLGDHISSDFSAIGVTTQPVNFKIKLMNCSDKVSGASLTFTGDTDTDDATLLALSDTGMGSSGILATGLGVQLLDKDKNSLPLNKPVLSSLTTGDNTLDYYLRYKSTKSVVTAGDATAVMYFDIQYQ